MRMICIAFPGEFCVHLTFSIIPVVMTMITRSIITLWLIRPICFTFDIVPQGRKFYATKLISAARILSNKISIISWSGSPRCSQFRKQTIRSSFVIVHLTIQLAIHLGLSIVSIIVAVTFRSELFFQLAPQIL